jgi:hypothetical protein
VLEQHEVDPTTPMNYESQIRNYIKPNLGYVPTLLLICDASERLENLRRRCGVATTFVRRSRPPAPAALTPQERPCDHSAERRGAGYSGSWFHEKRCSTNQELEIG